MGVGGYDECCLGADGGGNAKAGGGGECFDVGPVHVHVAGENDSVARVEGWGWVAVGVLGLVAGVLEDGEGHVWGHGEQVGDLEEVGALGVCDVAVAPCGGGYVLEVLAVGAVGSVVREAEHGGQPRQGEQFVGADDAVFEDSVEDAEVGVDVAAVTSGQAVDEVG